MEATGNLEDELKVKLAEYTQAKQSHLTPLLGAGTGFPFLGLSRAEPAVLV